MKRTLLLSAVCAGVFFASCSKKSNDVSPSSNNGTTSKQTDMSYQLVATNKTANVEGKSTATANIVWTSGMANPRMIKFEAKKDGTEIEYKSTNVDTIDLMNPISFGGFTIPSGTYDEIELRIDLEKEGRTPALRLEGQFTNSTLSLPVVVEIDEPIELKTEQQDVTITDDMSFVAVTTLDLSTYTLGITTTMLLNAKLDNGVLVISSTSNKDLYNKILAHLHANHHVEFHHHKR